MLTLGSAKDYRWPVSVRLATDGGRFENFEFVAVFKRLPQGRLDEISAAMAGDDEEGAAITDGDLVREVLVGWDKVRDVDGSEVPFNSDTLAQALDVPGVRLGLVHSWFESLAVGKRKN